MPGKISNPPLSQETPIHRNDAGQSGSRFTLLGQWVFSILSTFGFISLTRMIANLFFSHRAPSDTSHPTLSSGMDSSGRPRIYKANHMSICFNIVKHHDNIARLIKKNDNILEVFQIVRKGSAQAQDRLHQDRLFLQNFKQLSPSEYASTLREICEGMQSFIDKRRESIRNLDPSMIKDLESNQQQLTQLLDILES